MTTADSHGVGSTEDAARLGGRAWAMVVILTVSTFIVMLDVSAVNIAVPVILADLAGTLDEATWVLAGFVLSFAVLLLTFGKLADVYGRRLLFVAGIVTFAGASLAAALAPSMEFLIGARVLQGVGAAMVEPTVLALIKATIPPGRLGLAFGVQGIAAGLGAALGPTLGGVITTTLSWEYIFYLNVPMGIGAIVGAFLVIPESRDAGASRRLDVPGLLTSAAGLFALVFAIVEGPRLGWGSPVIFGSLAAAAVLMTVFVLVELRVRDPLVDLGLFKDRLFAVGNILRMVVQFVTLGLLFPLVLFLQIQLGYSPLESGLLLLPFVVAATVTSPLAGGLSDRVDVRWLVIPGLLLLAAGTFYLAHLSPATDWTFFLVPLAIVGAGLGALEAPTTSATLRDVPTARSGIASSLSYTTLLLGAELGVAIAAAVLQNRFIAGVRAALADVSSADVDRIVSAWTEGGIQPTGDIDAPGNTGDLIQEAFADAVNSALFGCVAAALAGAVIAMFFARSSRTTRHPARAERNGQQESQP